MHLSHSTLEKFPSTISKNLLRKGLDKGGLLMATVKHVQFICASLAFTFLVAPASFAATSQKVGARANMAAPLSRKRIEPAFRERLFKGKVSIGASKGESLLVAGKFDEASRTFRQALNKNSKDTAALTGLGFALASQFKIDGADQQFTKALAVDPKFALAHVGKAYVTLNRLQSSNMTVIKQKASMLANAESECQQALQNDPGCPEAYATLGMVQKEQGRINEAISSYSKAIDGDPKFGQAYAKRGLAELETNNLAAAESDFKEAIRLRSSNSTAHYGLAKVYLAQGNADAALKELNTSLYLNPNSGPVQTALGDAYRMQKNYNAAIAAYQKAILIKSENEQAYLNLSDIREERGDLELSMAEIRSGLELNPNDVPLHMRLGDLALKLEKTDDSIKEYTNVLQLQPGNAEACKGLTRGYVQKAQKDAQGAFFLSNDFEKAEGMLQQAIKMNPNDMELRLVDAKFRAMSGKQVDLSTIGTPTNDPERIAYAEALTAQFRFDEAAQQMQTVINNSNDSKQLLAVADISLMNRDLDSAQAAYTKASTLPDASARAKRGLDQVAKAREDARKELTFANDLARKKQLASGIDKYRNAAYLNPRLADAHFGLAEALKKFFPKNPASLREAAQHYRAFISLSPNMPEKEREKINKMADKLVEKAYKIEQKQPVTD
jgi:tetratricopeptide (TPR) repeat protein